MCPEKHTEPVPPPRRPMVELWFLGAGSTSFRLLPRVSTFLFFFLCFSSSCAQERHLQSANQVMCSSRSFGS